MPNIQRSRLMVAALVALSFIGLCSSPSPAAASTLSATMYCTGLGGGPPRGYFYCNASVSGGSGSYSYLWQLSSNALIDSQSNGSSSSHIDGSCRSNYSYTVTFTVTDSLGATASSISRGFCSTIQP
jgi:hypothetical protein